MTYWRVEVTWRDAISDEMLRAPPPTGTALSHATGADSRQAGGHSPASCQRNPRAFGPATSPNRADSCPADLPGSRETIAAEGRRNHEDGIQNGEHYGIIRTERNHTSGSGKSLTLSAHKPTTPLLSHRYDRAHASTPTGLRAVEHGRAKSVGSGGAALPTL